MSEKDIVDCCQRLKLECKPIAEKVCFFYSFQETQTFPISKYQPPISVGGKTLITLTKIRREIMKHSFLTLGGRHVLWHILFIHLYFFSAPRQPPIGVAGTHR